MDGGSRGEGLATAARLARRGDEILVVEKEPVVAAHQTGRNLGVIHSGLYYAPGNLKACLGNAGAASMKQFASEHGVPPDTTERAVANRVPGRLVSPDEAHDYEPRVACVGALRIETTAPGDQYGLVVLLPLDDPAGPRAYRRRAARRRGAELRRPDQLAGRRHPPVTDVWPLDVDPEATPVLFIPQAWSPTVVRTP